MTKIQQMIDAGIPVIVSQSNETNGSYAFEAMTDEQQKVLQGILGGYTNTISADSNIIIGDGVDDILLTVTGAPGALVTVSTLAGATAGTIDVQLDADGNGSQVFACETSPTVIVFSHGEQSVKVRAL